MSDVEVINIKTNIEVDTAAIAAHGREILKLIKKFWSQLGTCVHAMIVEATLANMSIDDTPLPASIMTGAPLAWVQTGEMLTKFVTSANTKNLNLIRLNVYPKADYGFILDRGVKDRQVSIRRTIASMKKAISRKYERIQEHSHRWHAKKREEIQQEFWDLRRRIGKQISRLNKWRFTPGMQAPRPIPERPWIGVMDDARLDEILKTYLLPFYDRMVEVFSGLAIEGNDTSVLSNWVRREMNKMAKESKRRMLAMIEERKASLPKNPAKAEAKEG